MPYWQLFYHIVTATQGRLPRLAPAAEAEIQGWIRSKVYQLEGILYAVNGTEDHVHLVVSIPPKIAIADFIGQVKGFSSGQYNRAHPEHEHFAWQTEYGVFSFDRKRLEACVAYVAHQKEHHQTASLIPALERMTEEGHSIAEASNDYDPFTSFLV